MSPVGTFASAVHIAAPTSTFPVIATSNSEVGTSLGSSNPIPAPTGITAGDLLVAALSIDNPISVQATPSTGWTQIINLPSGSTSNARLTVWARIADGGANDALTLTGATQDYCAAILRINNHGVSDIATHIKQGAVISATGQIDPPSLDAGSIKTWLWLAVGAVEFTTGNTVSAPPASYSTVLNLKSADSTSSCGLAIAQREREIQTEDPGTFTNTTGRAYTGATIAIPPVP